MENVGGQQSSDHATGFQLDLSLGFHSGISERNPNPPSHSFVVFSLDRDFWLSGTGSPQRFCLLAKSRHSFMLAFLRH